MTRVSSEMTRKVTYALEDDNIERTYQAMRALGVRHVPVTRLGRLVGILSDRDILLHAHPDRHGTVVVPSKPVEAVMTKDVITCHEDEGIGSCVDKLLQHKIDALPVVNSSGKLVGILTTTDMLRLLRDRDWEPKKPLPFKWESIPLLTQWSNWREATA
jgi:CBS domain-containing protein